MFRSEWTLQRPGEELRRIAIVDDSPAKQPMYPEFLLFRRLFERAGLEAVIADPSELELQGGALRIGRARIDLVYNRLCDFYFESRENAVLREVYWRRAAVVTPHPRAYALYADKRNLTLFSDLKLLRDWRVGESASETLAAGIPATVRVTRENAGELWARRRALFFKPANGYGSRGAYRGAKLTRRVWENIVAGDYVAQTFVPPSRQEVATKDGTSELKVDVRAYIYDGEIQLLGARLYQGQTTNLRTPGGGFAPVFTEAVTGSCAPADGSGTGPCARSHHNPNPVECARAERIRPSQ
jgi:hypothetical protein